MSADVQKKTTTTGPSLPLPELTPKTVAVDNWPNDRFIANSMRAWHYKPQMVVPLRALGASIAEDKLLSDVTIIKLVAVVTARNRCFY